MVNIYSIELMIRFHICMYISYSCAMRHAIKYMDCMLYICMTCVVYIYIYRGRDHCDIALHSGALVMIDHRRVDRHICIYIYSTRL